MADHFVRRYCREYQLPTKTLSHSARAALRSHDWPGNVRELMNVMERATMLAGDRIEPADLGTYIRERMGSARSSRTRVSGPRFRQSSYVTARAYRRSSSNACSGRRAIAAS